MFLSSSATRGLYPGVLVGYTAKIEASSWVNSGLHGVILLSICQPLTYNKHLRNFSPCSLAVKKALKKEYLFSSGNKVIVRINIQCL